MFRSPSHNALNKFSATPAYDPSIDRFASSPSYDPGNSTPAYEITYESPAANEGRKPFWTIFKNLSSKSQR